MPLQIIHKDITRIECDAIVNPTDEFYSGSGGADYAIHKAAGPRLHEACDELEPLLSGECAVTPAFRLPCKYVIHTVGPIWDGGYYNEPVILRSCYLNALIKAKHLGVESIAFPLISSGAFGFPKDKVLRIAIDAISDFLFTMDEEFCVSICIVDKNAFELSKAVDLDRYIGRKNRIAEHAKYALRPFKAPEAAYDVETIYEHDECLPGVPELDVDFQKLPISSCAAPPPHAASAPAPEALAISLEDWIEKQDDTFQRLLFKLIEKKGMDPVQCYKKANLQKNVFYNIRSDPNYRPSKETVIAFAVSLELSLGETDALLKSAGLALSRNNLFDLIVEYYIKEEIYDIFEINQALYKYDQKLLGWNPVT
jgi:Predicted phosphatase homologous to the C-terminal domain of histone macroH2A1